MTPIPEENFWIVVPSSVKWRTWILSTHYENFPSPGGRARTLLGDLVYRSKYHRDQGALDKLVVEIQVRLTVLSQLPPRRAIDSISVVSAVPCYPPKALSLPHEIARVVAETLGVPDISSYVVKIHQTDAAKANPGNHAAAYEIRTRLDGQNVLLVDDLYRTGMTLESVASNLRAAGAENIIGLCVTRAHQGMTP